LIPLLADEVRETGSLLLSSAQKSWDVFLFICDFDFHGMAWDLNTVNHFISHVSLLPCGTSGADIQSKWNALLYWFCVLRFVLLDWKMSYSPIISQILHSYKIFFFFIKFFFLMFICVLWRNQWATIRIVEFQELWHDKAEFEVIILRITQRIILQIHSTYACGLYRCH
jgi:hypothetical protein